jgi:hypothetical protein
MSVEPCPHSPLLIVISIPARERHQTDVRSPGLSTKFLCDFAATQSRHSYV